MKRVLGFLGSIMRLGVHAVPYRRYEERAKEVCVTTNIGSRVRDRVRKYVRDYSEREIF